MVGPPGRELSLATRRGVDVVPGCVGRNGPTGDLCQAPFADFRARLPVVGGLVLAIVGIGKFNFLDARVPTLIDSYFPFRFDGRGVL
jgi:hypothetical protein